MTRKPPSMEAALRQEWSTAEDLVKYGINRHDGPTIHLVEDRYLTTAGSQFTTYNFTNSSANSKSSWYINAGKSTFTISWPGLEDLYVTELECGLTNSLMCTGAASTVGYRWEIMDDDESTYTPISTWKTLKAGTSTAVERTVSGYAKLGTGYNKLPLKLRMRFYGKSVKSKARIKNSSYVAINRVSKTA